MPLASNLSVSIVILRVKNLERAAAFYTETLGLTATQRFEGFVFLEAGPVTLVLNQPSNPVESVTAGLTEVVFEVKDILATHQELLGRGVEFIYAPKIIGRAETYDRYAAPFRDPDGHLLSITSMVERGWTG